MTLLSLLLLLYKNYIDKLAKLSQPPLNKLTVLILPPNNHNTKLFINGNETFN